MSTPDEVIKQWKSIPERELMLRICDSITETNDLTGQIIRTHLWAQTFIDGTLYQISKYSEKDSFATKQRRLYELGIIDETHNQELKILNHIRNLVSHNLHPNQQILDSVKKLPRYDPIKIPSELQSLNLGIAEMGEFGRISFFLLIYLLKIFYDPKME